MFSKTNLISTLVTALWVYFGGYLIWVIIATPLTKGHEGTATDVWKEVPDQGILILGCVIVAFALSTIYSKLSGEGHSLSFGATYGLWIGILIGFGEGMINLAVANFSDLTGTLINGVLAIVFYGIMGALTSVVYKKMSD